MAKEYVYKVEGMHCASCEILIEKKLLDLPNIKSVSASTAKGEAVVEYEGEKLSTEMLDQIFKYDNYKFLDYHKNNIQEVKEIKPENIGNSTLFGFAIAMGVVVIFLLLDKMGISGLVNIGSKSSLITFFGFGLLAGLSSCAALVGGIVLSMSKQWNNLYSENQSTVKKLQPHILFNAGRIISYALLGGVLGLIGSRLAISLSFTAWLVVAISLFMIALGLQMLGVPGFKKFQFSMPKTITRKVANEHNFAGKYMPFLMGALTFFLPCGFTITAQTVALLSGSAIQGALVMGMFALGTAPMLFLIGLSSVKFSSKPHWSATFSKVAGFLVLFFALYNIYNQINILTIIGFK